MGFVEDKVKEYIQGNYAKFQDLRLNQMLLHLPCLTAADRQEILRETDRNGNISSLIEFFNRLWCRRGWVTQLISALRETNSDLADSIQEVYEAHLLPSQRRPPASSPSAVAPVAVPQGANAPPSDNSPLSLPRSQSRPTGDQPPKATNALTPEPSASLQDVVDYRAPVQETKCPSWNDKTAIEGKALGKDIKQKISTPGQHNRNAAESNASLAVQRENLTDVQVASPAALVRHHEHLREVSEEDRQSTEPVSSESDAGNLVRNWDGFQQRPVCVKNGYFGNMSRSVDSSVSSAPEPATSSGLTSSRNQPEEDSYLSSDCSPLAPRGQVGAQREEQRVQPLWGQEDLLDNPANNKPLLMRMQVDEKQKGAQSQQDSSSNVSTLPLLQKKGDGHSQQVNSRTMDVREMTNDAIPKGSAFADLQRKGKTLSPSIPGESTAASCSEQDSSSICSEEVSQDHSLCCETPPSVGQLSEGCMAGSKGNTVVLDTKETPQTASSLGRSFSESSPFPPRSSIKEHVDQIPNTVPVGRFSSPPFNFAGSSSTDVIPPSSPVAVSSILSDGYSEDLKAPVQERELAKTNLWTTSERITGDASLRATIASPSSVTDSPTNSREKRNNAGGPSRDARIFYSNREEEDISLFKPGVLSSEEVTGGPLDRLSINPGRVYSGTSDRLRMSDEYSEKSDPLMLSASTWSSHSEESGRNLSTGTNINHSDEDSIRTHTVHVRESPSADLAGAPQITRPALGNASQSPGDSLDSVAGDQLIKNASSPPVRNDSQRNSLQNESVSDTASSHMSGSVLLAVGFALISLVALVVYKQVKK